MIPRMKLNYKKFMKIKYTLEIRKHFFDEGFKNIDDGSHIGTHWTALTHLVELLTNLYLNIH